MSSDSQEITYSMTYRDAVRILELVKTSTDLTSFNLEYGDFKLALERKSEVIARTSVEGRAGEPVPPVASTVGASARGPSIAAPEVSNDDGEIVTVRAPLLGTFYCTSAPGEPPYVVAGQKVSVNDTIGLIEVMKLFTPVNAGVAGVVEEIVAVHGELVEYDQPLLRIRPEQDR
jgi:acetyl-CoA carboxylase biotin carboxyl carrier protein